MQYALIWAAFFDARDTLSEVDRPAAGLTAKQGTQMIASAVLPESPRLAIGNLVAAGNIIN